MKKNNFYSRIAKYSLMFLSLVACIIAKAQSLNPPVQLAPANGANGIHGPVSGSYIMTWSSVPNAVSYQWINSNNHLCFYGCAGDTRTETVPDTNWIIYYIPDNEWRYWIVRAFLANGDTTYPSGIFSFLPKKDGTEVPLFSISPNPAKDKITVAIDWFSNPKINKIIYRVMDIQGQFLAIDKSFRLNKNGFIRNEEHTLELPLLNPGIYFIILTTDNNNQEFSEKVVIE